MLRRRLGPVGLVAVVSVLPACGVSGGSATDGPTYGSVEALAERAEVVVIGAVGSERETEVDDGGNEDGRGPEITFYDFEVNDVLASSDEPASVMPGVTLPLGVGTGSPLELVEGVQLVLFLDEVTSEDAPGIDTEDLFYVVIGADAEGAFDVREGQVIARSENVRSLAAGDPPADIPFTVSLKELQPFLQPAG
jgi:hypothetical protein